MNNPFKKLWYCFRYDNSEITAWLKTSSARAPETVVVSLFTSTALLFLANQLDTNCDDRVDIGFIVLRISSVLSGASVVENIVNVVLAPFWGSLADATSNRRALLILASILWVGAVGVGAFMLFFDPSLTLLWLFFGSVLITAVFYELALLLLFAYLPEIVDDEEQLTAITSRQYAIVNALQLFAAALLVAISLVLPDDVGGYDGDLVLSIMAHFVVVIIWLYYGVPGLIHLPARTTPKIIVKRGGAIKELIATGHTIYREYPNIGWFLLGWMFYFAGVASVTLLQVAYVTEEFDFKTSDVSYLGALVLIFSVIGALLAEHLSKRFKLKTLLLASIFLWTCVCFIAPWLMRGQDRETPETENVTTGSCAEILNFTREPTAIGLIAAYVFAMILGIGIGFLYPVSTSIYVLIIPGGNEASYFGVKTFGAKVISWAPPLIFTVLNEATDNLQVAFMSLGLWFAFSIPFVMKMNVEQGILDVADTIQHRQGAGKHDFNVEAEEKKIGLPEIESVHSVHSVRDKQLDVEVDGDKELGEDAGQNDKASL